MNGFCFKEFRFSYALAGFCQLGAASMYQHKQATPSRDPNTALLPEHRLGLLGINGAIFSIFSNAAVTDESFGRGSSGCGLNPLSRPVRERVVWKGAG